MVFSWYCEWALTALGLMLSVCIWCISPGPFTLESLLRVLGAHNALD